MTSSIVVTEPSSLREVERWNVDQLTNYLNEKLNEMLNTATMNEILKTKAICGFGILNCSKDELVNLGMEYGVAVCVVAVINRLKTRFESFTLNCIATYKKNKKNFTIRIIPGSPKDYWSLLQGKIKIEFFDLLEDVDEKDVSIKSNDVTIKDKNTFDAFLEEVEIEKGLKNINFGVETSQINFSKYKKLSDLVDIFGENVKDAAMLGDLPQMKLPIGMNTFGEELDDIVNHVVTRLKLLMNTSGPISENNEVERSYYIDAVLRDIVKSFGEKVQINQQFKIVGSHGNGCVDFIIRHENTIICITEAKATELELGICQNFIQLHSACKTNLRKRKVDNEYEYVYGIVSTGEQWVFTVVSSDNKLASTIKAKKTLGVGDCDVKDDRLKDEVKILVKAILGIFQDKIVSISEQPQQKKLRLESILPSSE